MSMLRDAVTQLMMVDLVLSITLYWECVRGVQVYNQSNIMYHYTPDRHSEPTVECNASNREQFNAFCTSRI